MFRCAARKLRYLERNVCKKDSSWDLKKVRFFVRTPVRWKSQNSDANQDIEFDVPNTISSKYEVFSEKTAPIILDIEEERSKVLNEQNELLQYDEFEGLRLERGLTGVFDIEDLVVLLRRENAIDLFVARIPPEFKYADYIVVVTAKSVRHMQAMAEFVRKIYKRKMNKSDILPMLEGKGSKDWMALDLSNIILHIFSTSARNYYDLETLWAVGKEFDTLSHKDKHATQTLLTDYSQILASLTPDTPQKE